MAKNRFFAWYRSVSRYSTVTLILITLVLSGYLWWTWPRIQYETFCANEEINFQQRFKTAQACDAAVFEFMSQPGQSCPKAGCREIVD